MEQTLNSNVTMPNNQNLQQQSIVQPEMNTIPQQTTEAIKQKVLSESVQIMDFTPPWKE